MSTAWNATATVRQPVQRAKAYASLRCSTLAPPRTHVNALRTSTVVAPSLVLMARAWLSPGFGSRGGENGNTHAGSPMGAGWAAACGAGAGAGGGSGAGSGSGAAAGGAAAGGSSSGPIMWGSQGKSGVKLPPPGRSGRRTAGGAVPAGAG